MATTGGADHERAQAVAEAALRQAAATGVSLPADLRLWTLAGLGTSPAPAAVGGPSGEALASVLEAVTPPAQRRVNGLHVTPAWLADELVALALDGVATRPDELTICDPACGGGAFLLSAARALHARGVPRDCAVRQVWGADVDPVGLAAAEVALVLWAGEPPPPGHLVVGDPLLTGLRLWPTVPPGGFGAVVGNPPFLNQLGRTTVRSAAETGRLRQRFGEAVQPYTDTAWLFLLLGCELASDGGRVTLIQPMSLVAARDAAVVREALSDHAELRHLWVEPGRSFAAGVKVCAPVLEIRRSRTREGGVGSTWADRLADAIGIPRVVVGPARGAVPVPRLGERATVLAGFRDEYYGLVPLVREAEKAASAGLPGDGERPLVTAGVIDWGRCVWGGRPSRFAKQMWAAPVVDLDQPGHQADDEVAQAAARWVRRTAVPKIVVATQTRVVEAAVDVAGCWVPSVPTLAVLPEHPDDLWPLAAALAAPTATAWLLRRAPETGLSRGALKIAARDLADLPLPVDATAWEAATAALQTYVREPTSNHVETFARAAGAAYAAPESLVDWWRRRLG
jgi:hypothetical protein